MAHVMPMRSATPPVVLAYGLLGIVPFLAPAVVGVAFPEVKDAASFALALYSGLILSFLGGARWGFANAGEMPGVVTVSVSMLPTLVALGLLVMPPGGRRLQLAGLAVALALHWTWDLFSGGLPAWYGRLRTLLTAGAVTGIVAGVFALT